MLTFTGANTAVYVTRGIKLSHQRDRGNEASLIGCKDGDACCNELTGEENYLSCVVDGSIEHVNTSTVTMRI